MRVIVIQGSEKAGAGDNLRAMGTLPDDFLFMSNSPATHAGIQQRLRSSGRLTIVAINGFALGAGLDDAMACDFRAVADTVWLQDQRVIDCGMHAVSGCAWLQTRAVVLLGPWSFLFWARPLTALLPKLAEW